MVSEIFKGNSICNQCGQSHRIVQIDDSTVIREFSYNYYIQKGHEGCAWSEDERYCVLIKYDDFMEDPEKYINYAFDKRTDPIAEKVCVYPKHDN